MTLLHGPQSGDIVRTGRGHDVPAGSAERRLHRHQGSNMAECHPVGFRWVMKAKERGATIIHVDPRFTRTRRRRYPVPIRAGSDIAFLGGIIHYILENERYFHEYVVNYTNAPASSNDDFRTPRISTDSSAAGIPRKAKYKPRPGCTRAWSRRGGGRRRETLSPAPARTREQATSGRAHRTDAPASALRVSDPQAPLLALHARDGGRDLRHARRTLLRRWPKRSAATRDASARRASATRSAGRSTPSACRYIRTAASSSCCSATWDGRAAGSWRCAGTPRSRARRTSRHSTICCPAICPMPKAKHDKDFETTSISNESPSGWWGEFREVLRSPC